LLEEFKQEDFGMRRFLTIILVLSFGVPLLSSPATTVTSGDIPVALTEKELAQYVGGTTIVACLTSLGALGGAISGYGGLVAAAAGPIGWGLGAALFGSLVVLAAAGAATGYNCGG
jgi:hypothetical protein